MLKYCVLAAVFSMSLISCVAAYAAPVMAMDSQSNALASNTPADEMEPAAVAADTTGTASTVHGPRTGYAADSIDETSHGPMHPEGATAAPAPKATLATPAADPLVAPPAHKPHNTVRWQSLLPGVMK